MADSHTELWDRVCTTDPRHTKNVDFGGHKFTSIDAQYKLRRVTEEFGPCGEGWGYNTESRVVDCGEGLKLAVVSVTFWYEVDGATRKIGPITSSCELVKQRATRQDGPQYDTQGRPVLMVDTDAFKKAETDALSKCFSRLGFFADVYLGMFDDDKYVQQSRDRFASDDVRKDLMRRAETAISEAIVKGDRDRQAEILAYVNKLYREQMSISGDDYRHLLGLMQEFGYEVNSQYAQEAGGGDQPVADGPAEE